MGAMNSSRETSIHTLPASERDGTAESTFQQGAPMPGHDDGLAALDDLVGEP